MFLLGTVIILQRIVFNNLKIIRNNCVRITCCVSKCILFYQIFIYLYARSKWSWIGTFLGFCQIGVNLIQKQCKMHFWDFGKTAWKTEYLQSHREGHRVGHYCVDICIYSNVQWILWTNDTAAYEVIFHLFSPSFTNGFPNKNLESEK